jgi:hypothetical protein
MDRLARDLGAVDARRARSDRVRIEWINHAAYVLEAGGVRLVADPWIDGRAFDDGWAHVTPTRLRYEDFADVTHVWFSHEHPDHFSPSNVRKIPESARRRITVLYQRTRDRKVARFCEAAGFARVVELPRRRWFAVAPGFDVMNEKVGNDDSWLAVRTGGKILLNLNDCVIRTEAPCAAIRRLLGGAAPDVLLTQFSYANWSGNSGDVAAHRAAASERLDRARLQATALGARSVVPFASFVWFCHEENAFHNEGMNRVEDAHAAIESLGGPRSVVLFPGETWDVGAPRDSAASIERYRPEYERALRATELVKSPPVALETLRGQADEFVARLLRKNGALFRLARRRNPFPAALVGVADHGVTAEFSLERGLVPVANPARPCDAAASSSALSYAFVHEWGGGTLHVNGRYTAPPGGDAQRLFLYFELSGANNRGVTFPSLFVQRLVARLRATEA